MISIIVPIYKVENYLEKCIESIISQTYKEIEVILVDDGSPDACPQICDKYAAMDNRIKVIHKENEGLVSARKSGVDAANGEYIGFVDGDDYIESDMFYLIADMIERYNPDVIMNEYFLDYEDNMQISSQIPEREYYNKEELKKEIYPNMLFDGEFYKFGIAPNCWSKVFKKDILVKNLSMVDNQTKMGEDAAFTYPCLFEAQSLCYINLPLYHYRILASSMSRGFDENLSSIVYLAYIRLNVISKDELWSKQLVYYKLYLDNFVIRNQAKKMKNANDIGLVNNLIKDSNFNQPVQYKKLPYHTRIVYFGLKYKLSLIIVLYIKFLRIILKRK